MKKHILDGLIVVTAIGLLFCLGSIGLYYFRGFQYDKTMDALMEKIQGGIATPFTPTPTKAVEVVPEDGGHTTEEVVKEEEHITFSREISAKWKEQYQTLTSENADCAGFLEIPDTKIAFPVMFREGDPQYYLYRNFQKKSESRGTPFLDGATVLGESKNYIVYGHNMKDGSVFGSLLKYRDAEYCYDHRYLFFNTATSEGVYEVFAVCWVRIDTKSDGFRYDEYGGNLSKADFETYVKEVKACSMYPSDLEVGWWDELLTLSTCLHEKANDNGRLIVVAKRVS